MSKIEWCDETWNPVTGCTKISTACDNCYAERMSKRMAGRFGYPRDESFRVTMHLDKLSQPMRWKKPRRVFVVSMGDLFHEAVPSDYIAAIFSTMALATQHTFMVLTKRPQRMKYWMEWAVNAPHDLAPIRDTWPLPNVWLGVTAEDQEHADDRIPVLLSIPAAKHFVSCEPMLGAIDIKKYLEPSWSDYCEYHDYGATSTTPDECPGCSFGPSLDWVIAGGETGPRARPMHPDWVCSLRDQCVEAEVPFFFKQWGGFRMNGESSIAAGARRLIDGRTWNEMPEVAR
jgi:protein gp37